MDIAKIRHLIERASQGDQDALIDLLEWAETQFLTADLAQAPAGVRAEALAGVAALWKARRAAINRARKIKTVNTKRDAAKHVAVDEALKHVALFSQPIPKLVKLVRKYLITEKLCTRSNLPERRFVARKVREAQDEKRLTLL